MSTSNGVSKALTFLPIFAVTWERDKSMIGWQVVMPTPDEVSLHCFSFRPGY